MQNWRLLKALPALPYLVAMPTYFVWVLPCTVSPRSPVSWPRLPATLIPL